MEVETEESLNNKIHSINLVYIEQLKKLLTLSSKIKHISIFSLNKKELNKEFTELKIIVDSLHKLLRKYNLDIIKIQSGEKIYKESEFNEDYIMI
jgi:hypothetical protein